MKIKIKNGDGFVEVDSEFPRSEIEIDNDLEDTMEINTKKINDSVSDGEYCE